jgi:hypothetical protein
MPTTVVFIYGAWLTPASWDRFCRGGADDDVEGYSMSLK